MLYRIRRMLIKEFLQMLRDPRMRIVVFGIPVIQMTIMAFALTTDVMNIRTAVLDMDKTPASRELIAAFTASKYFQIVYSLDNERQLTDLLDHGAIRAALHIPSGYGGDLSDDRTATFQLHRHCRRLCRDDHGFLHRRPTYRTAGQEGYHQ